MIDEKENLAAPKPLTFVNSIGWSIILCGLLFTFACFVRIPYFVPTVIHWHESTYILLGQDLLQGHLPQTVLSELKPPFSSLPYAFFLLFGKSVFSVRVGGTLCVAFASIATFLTCKRVVCTRAAFVAAALVSIFVTIEDQAGCTLLEHIALVPLCAMAYLWLDEPADSKRMFWLGVLIGIATALKTNLVFFILAPIAFQLLSTSSSSSSSSSSSVSRVSSNSSEKLRNISCLVLGSVIPNALIFLAYFVSNNFLLYWNSTLVAAGAAAAEHRRELPLHIPDLWRQAQGTPLVVWLLAWCLPFCGCILTVGEDEQKRVAFRRQTLLIIAAGFVSILTTGSIHSRRYFIVLVPFLAQMSSLALDWLLCRKYKVPAQFIALSVFALIALNLIPVFHQYNYLSNWLKTNGESDTALQIARYLNLKNVKGKYVYFQTSQIGYLLTDARIPNRFIHPTDLTKPYLLKTLYSSPTSAEEELDSIFSKEPQYVVTHIRREGAEDQGEFIRRLDRVLKEHYQLEKQIGTVGIFSRKL